jgi:hypothetical protein
VRRGDPRQAVVGGSGGFGGALPRLHALGEGWIRVGVKRHVWTVYRKASREQALAILRRETSDPLLALNISPCGCPGGSLCGAIDKGLCPSARRVQHSVGRCL